MYNDKYALITGASDGFGKAMALQCASLKMNVILVALAGPELYYLTTFIQNNYGVKAVCFEKIFLKNEVATNCFKK
ncbi:MAG: SDR family NAD(P)-dependent oxidoreductase [Chitinophagaceae bacterium]|nr:SDR family NAD(P)-dependent oxidoreductase [Chitinophagaceae bacterium]